MKDEKNVNVIAESDCSLILRKGGSKLQHAVLVQRRVGNPSNPSPARARCIKLNVRETYLDGRSDRSLASGARMRDLALAVSTAVFSRRRFITVSSDIHRSLG